MSFVRLAIGVFGVILTIFGADAILKHDWSTSYFPIETMLMVSIGVFIVLFILSNRFRV